MELHWISIENCGTADHSGPCPILNGSDAKVKYQDDLSKKEYYDMVDVDEEYDAAVRFDTDLLTEWD